MILQLRVGGIPNQETSCGKGSATPFTQLVATSALKQLIRSRFVQAVPAYRFPSSIKQSLTQYHRLPEQQLSLTRELWGNICSPQGVSRSSLLQGNTGTDSSCGPKPEELETGTELQLATHKPLSAFLKGDVNIVTLCIISSYPHRILLIMPVYAWFFSPGHLLHHSSHSGVTTQILWDATCNERVLISLNPKVISDYPILFLTFKSIFPLLSVNYNARFLGTRINVFTFGVGTKGLFAVLSKSDSYTFIRSNSTFLCFLDQATGPLDCLRWQIHFDHTPKGLPRWSKICSQMMRCLKGSSSTGLHVWKPHLMPLT